jgi:hypothetical protein
VITASIAVVGMGETAALFKYSYCSAAGKSERIDASILMPKLN